VDPLIAIVQEGTVVDVEGRVDENQARTTVVLESGIREAAGVRILRLHAVRQEHVPIDPRQALREHLRALEKGQDNLFLLPNGKLFDEYGYQPDFKAAAERAGIAPFTLHDLRHAAGVRLAEAGATPAEIAAFIGHRTLAMTMRYIRHAPRDAARSAARLLDRMQAERQKGAREDAG